MMIRYIQYRKMGTVHIEKDEQKTWQMGEGGNKGRNKSAIEEKGIRESVKVRERESKESKMEKAKGGWERAKISHKMKA